MSALRCRVLEVRRLSASLVVLRFERHGCEFQPGQNLRLGLRNASEIRDYSIASGIHDPYWEILVRRVEGGTVSAFLYKATVGDELSVFGPYGIFAKDLCLGKQTGKALWVATGTGLAPFLSLARSYENLRYHLFHGIRFLTDGFEPYPNPAQTTPCLSRGNAIGAHVGRVTEALRALDLSAYTQAYLCGNLSMIDEVRSLWASSGSSTDTIHTEVYF